MKPMSSLPLIIFNYAGSPYEEWHQLAWGASFVLIMLVLFLNIITKIVETRWKNTILKVRNFNAYFGATKVLRNVNLEIPQNQIVALMGPSGCG